MQSIHSKCYIGINTMGNAAIIRHLNLFEYV
jgi:hypothetical protein